LVTSTLILISKSIAFPSELENIDFSAQGIAEKLLDLPECLEQVFVILSCMIHIIGTGRNLGSDLESIFNSVSKFWNEGADTGSSEF
jgi:hypothetical protein